MMTIDTYHCNFDNKYEEALFVDEITFQDLRKKYRRQILTEELVQKRKEELKIKKLPSKLSKQLKIKDMNFVIHDYPKVGELKWDHSKYYWGRKRPINALENIVETSSIEERSLYGVEEEAFQAKLRELDPKNKLKNTIGKVRVGYSPSEKYYEMYPNGFRQSGSGSVSDTMSIGHSFYTLEILKRKARVNEKGKIELLDIPVAQNLPLYKISKFSYINKKNEGLNEENKQLKTVLYESSKKEYPQFYPIVLPETEELLAVSGKKGIVDPDKLKFSIFNIHLDKSHKFKVFNSEEYTRPRLFGRKTILCQLENKSNYYVTFQPKTRVRSQKTYFQTKPQFFIHLDDNPNTLYFILDANFDEKDLGRGAFILLLEVKRHSAFQNYYGEKIVEKIEIRFQVYNRRSQQKNWVNFTTNKFKISELKESQGGQKEWEKWVERFKTQWNNLYLLSLGHPDSDTIRMEMKEAKLTYQELHALEYKLECSSKGDSFIIYGIDHHGDNYEQVYIYNENIKKYCSKNLQFETNYFPSTKRIKEIKYCPSHHSIKLRVLTYHWDIHWEQ